MGRIYDGQRVLLTSCGMIPPWISFPRLPLKETLRTSCIFYQQIFNCFRSFTLTLVLPDPHRGPPMSVLSLASLMALLFIVAQAEDFTNVSLESPDTRR